MFLKIPISERGWARQRHVLEVLTLARRLDRKNFYTSKTDEYNFANREGCFAVRCRYYTQSQLFVALTLTVRNLTLTTSVQMLYTNELRGARKCYYTISLNTVLI